ncbi:MAG: hypothetical protein ACOC3V_01995 [bacterium]
MLRKFIVRNFVLYKNFKLFGKTYNMLRASRIMFPSFLAGSILSIIFFHLILVKLLILVYLSTLVWVGFDLKGVGYFKLYPVKWEELDDEQKYQWGMINQLDLSSEQFQEWVKIKKHWKFI